MRLKLSGLWEKTAEPLMQSLVKRQGERSTSLERNLQERAEKEAGDIAQILTELQASIEQELKQPQVEQLELFNLVEKEQFERNMGSLKARLQQIPQEIEQETATIRSRFADPQARLFPLAVMYLVPEKLIH
jgi:dsDNA-binding SOS-regulon protein